MRGARGTAISADTRGFRATKRRSYLEGVHFSRIDYYAMAFIMSIVAFGIVSNFIGFARAIPYVA